MATPTKQKDMLVLVSTINTFRQNMMSCHHLINATLWAYLTVVVPLTRFRLFLSGHFGSFQGA